MFVLKYLSYDINMELVYRNDLNLVLEKCDPNASTVKIEQKDFKNTCDTLNLITFSSSLNIHFF